MSRLRNVFCLVTDCHASSGHYSRLWRQHFEEGLAAHVNLCRFPTGVDFSWSRLPPDLALPNERQLRSEQSEKLLSQIKATRAEAGVDAVVSYAYSRDLEPSLVDEVTQTLGIPWINFYCDSTHRFSLVKALAEKVTLNWFPESAATDRYKALGRKWVCLPYAVNPAHLPDLSLTEALRPSAFIGIPTANRIRMLGILTLRGGNVEIRGRGWVDERPPFYNPVPKWKRLRKILSDGGYWDKLCKRMLWPIVAKRAEGPLNEETFFTFIQTTNILLGLNQGRDELGNYDSYLKFRDIEFPGYGCCYLTEANPDVQTLFEPGREILTYSSMKEAARILKKLGTDDALCRRIGAAGRARVLKDHGWKTRVTQLSKALYG